ncbi:ATP-binding protein [Streptomyces griseoaurantiacus]|uniref:ATP-binding protein n=2 Tax=Streptomyces griseoaurantiacus TaxID=68213 RepID=UPI00345FA164
MTTHTHPHARPGPLSGPAEPAEALLVRLARLRERIAVLVDRRAAGDPTAEDPLRGLYLSEEAVRRYLAAPAGPVPAGVSEGEAPPDERDAGQVARLGLGELDTAILFLALAPDVDRSFEPLYGYLNDDVGRRRATVGLALDLCGVPAHRPGARARFHAGAPLTARGLLVVEEPERPFLTRSLRVPDRVVAHLLGDDTPDPDLAPHLHPLPPAPHGGPNPDDPDASGGEAEFASFTGRLAAHLARPGPGTVYLRERREGEGAACAAAALRAAGFGALRFDGPDEQAAALVREARLGGHALLVAPLPADPGPLLRELTAAPDVPVLLADPRPYDPHWCSRDPLVLDAPHRRTGTLPAWSAALTTPADGRTGAPAEVPGFDLAATVAPYRLGGERLERAARAARDLAAFDGMPLTPGHVRLAARRQSASGLEKHARRIRPDVDWSDLVLPAAPLTQLHELALRARHRERVLGDWRLSAGGGRGRGVLGLFAGESGTGKTLSAEVVAAELGLDLYVVQLSSVVDKYVGETEKNLERIFTEADRTDAVLLFDEADAVFGKRSEVKDSHDRYANMESAYLLQRLESFDGIALLTTNLRANIDEAFTRRLDLVVDFPFPDAGQRLALWRHGLERVPTAEGTHAGLAPLAREFELAGGSIRSAVVTAAYLAAGRDGVVTPADLLEGARREYRKAGRLVPGEGSW